MTCVNMRHEDVMLRRNGSPRSIGSRIREDTDVRSHICVNDWLVEIQEVIYEPFSWTKTSLLIIAYTLGAET